MVYLGFDASTVEPSMGFEPVPEGEYLCSIVESCDKDTKSGSGKYLQIKWQVLEGPYQGRTIYSRLNLSNNNQIAVEIARKELSAICHAAGIINVKDSAELHNIPCLLYIKLEKNQNSELKNNKITKYSPRSGARVNATPPANQAGSATPWGKK